MGVGTGFPVIRPKISNIKTEIKPVPGKSMKTFQPYETFMSVECSFPVLRPKNSDTKTGSSKLQNLTIGITRLVYSTDINFVSKFRIQKDEMKPVQWNRLRWN